MRFDYFVGVDWSGARGAAHKGIAVFVCEPGQEVPVKYPPPDNKRAFSRADVMALLMALSRRGRVLGGIDFAFAYPVDEAGHYFPNLKEGTQPQTAHHLWSLIDDVSNDSADYYGGLIWDHPLYGAYYNAPGGRKGALFQSRRRQTEQVAAAVKSPSPTFNCVGPAGVGTGSLAGMRMCHALSCRAAIWPFTAPLAADKPSGLTLVEIFPSYYFKMGGVTPVKGAQAQKENLNKALAYFGTNQVAGDFIAAGPDNDDADALISSAALRHFSSDKMMWHAPEIARREGWIFGVRSDKTPS